MKKILFFLPDLECGGAQRTVINIINHLDLSRLEPVLACGRCSGGFSGLIKTGARMIELDVSGVRNMIVPLARKIKSEKPDAVLSAYPDANIAVMFSLGLCRHKCRVIMRESNFRGINRGLKDLLSRNLLKKAYMMADKVIALSEGVRLDIISRYSLPQEKVITIHNPVDIKHIETQIREKPQAGKICAAAEGPNGGVALLGAGRLVYQKGFDILIKAYAKVYAPSLRLTILGDGPERNKLLRLSKEHKIPVNLPGSVRNPYYFMGKSDICIFPSRWEGFGHVIAEAMACGSATVASNCKYGPDEIITSGVDGMLFTPGSVDELAGVISSLAVNPAERRRLAENALVSVNRFEASKIAGIYSRVLTEG